jgi:hypothetical protein
MDRITEQYLFQDLSSVPADIVVPWVKEFIGQAAQERFWEARNAAQFTLKLRQSVALLATGSSDAKRPWPQAKKELESLIEWKQ